MLFRSTRMCDSSRSGPSRRPASPTSSTGSCRVLHHDRLHLHDRGEPQDFGAGFVSGPGRPASVSVCRARADRVRHRNRGVTRHRRGDAGDLSAAVSRVRRSAGPRRGGGAGRGRRPADVPAERSWSPVSTIGTDRACAPHQLTGEHDPKGPGRLTEGMPWSCRFSPPPPLPGAC